ncbi:MAG: phospholipase, partial [Alphaproteobacteria bacterium]|nr:phospholipase [Alphaproteobacteria bacterium]
STPAPMPLEGLREDPLWCAQWNNLGAGALAYPIHAIDSATQRIDDPPHDRATIALQIGTPTENGASSRMGGFIRSYEALSPPPADPSIVMGYYPADAVPVFDFFARNFAVCDHWYAALPTGTQANRLMAMSGTSSVVDNAPIYLPRQELVYDWLTAHGVSWCAYQAGDFLPFFALMPEWLPEIVSSLTLSGLGHRGRFRRYAAFREHWIAAEPMPQVIFIEPEYTDGPHRAPNDDHPPTGIAAGQAFLADIYGALTANPERWRDTMMVLTYDEHGGFFDHVPPLDIPANVAGFPFATTGIRVPAMVVSPQVAPGRVFDGKLDHTSILQLLADRFNPGKDYSAAVGARQPKLARLAAVLERARQPVRCPNLAPPPDGAALAAAAPLGDSRTKSATANAQAFHNAALKAARDHPELLARPEWDALRSYVARAAAPSM